MARWLPRTSLRFRVVVLLTVVTLACQGTRALTFLMVIRPLLLVAVARRLVVTRIGRGAFGTRSFRLRVISLIIFMMRRVIITARLMRRWFQGRCSRSDRRFPLRLSIVHMALTSESRLVAVRYRRAGERTFALMVGPLVRRARVTFSGRCRRVPRIAIGHKFGWLGGRHMNSSFTLVCGRIGRIGSRITSAGRRTHSASWIRWMRTWRTRFCRHGNPRGRGEVMTDHYESSPMEGCIT